MTITIDEYYMGRDKVFPGELTDAHKASAAKTVAAANTILTAFGQDRRVVSGWRPASINASTKGAATNSKHVLCQAVDLEDASGELKTWLMNNQDQIKACGFAAMESPAATPTWVHLQTVPPPSGHLVFIP